MMKISKLYIKIFLSFLSILFITEIVIFGLFFLIAGKTFRDRFVEYTAARVMILKEIVEDKIRYEPDVTPAQNIGLKEFINYFSETFYAKVWLVDSRGLVIIKSFTGPVPEKKFQDRFKRVKDFSSFRLYRARRGPYNYYTHVSIDLPNQETGSLNLLFIDRGPPHPERGFAWGLFFIGLIIALLCIPVSRLITKPIKRLKQSVIKITQGDLGHRADIHSRDEIGELGLAFNQMADQLERMIRGGRELTANVSHELRSPLARIRVAEEILREKCEQAGYKDGLAYLNEIQEEIVELDRLIDRILYLSKLDVHESNLKQEKIHLKPIIEGIAERHYSTIKRKEIELTLEIEDEAWILGDHEALMTIISNIFDNAVKFTGLGGRIEIKTSTDEKDLRIQFINSFPKINDEELIQIFEPFHRTGTIPEASGSGLGLAIVKKIIVSHGGEIEARNTEDGFMIDIHYPAQIE